MTDLEQAQTTLTQYNIPYLRNGDDKDIYYILPTLAVLHFDENGERIDIDRNTNT